MTSLNHSPVPYGPVTALPGGVGEMIASRLRRVHERAAQAAERWTPGAAATIATHYERSGARDKAYEYALLVAERARKKYVHRDAVEFLRMAERNATTAAQVADTRVRLAEVAELQGRYDEAEGFCTAALVWLSQNGDRSVTIPVQRLRERIRVALGHPSKNTLDTLLALDKEASTLGMTQEHASLLLMISQMHGRLGDRAAAEQIAQECVRIAETLSEPTILAQSLNRLGAARHEERPQQAAELYRRALDIFRTLEDEGGQSRCHNNLGIIHTRAGEYARAEAEFDAAVNCARTADMMDFLGVAALNLGVVFFKRGKHERARELFGEAYAVFATAKKQDMELYALFNLAHLERERGESEIAAEIYEVTNAMARHGGHVEVEVGSLAGAGLCYSEMGDVDAAYAALRGARERLSNPEHWFQGRELLETLGIKIDVTDGRATEAFAALDRAIAQGGNADDPYGTAWMIAECAGPLAGLDRARMKSIVATSARQITGLPFDLLTKRHAEFLATA